MKLFINKDIMNVSDMERWCFGIDAMSFSDIHDYLNYIKDYYPEDPVIDVEIHSCGGDTVEGYAIYDALRSSGKQISCTVVGRAASMATVILLAAPAERRFAYEHAQLLIHSPYFPGTREEELTIEKLNGMKSALESERAKMLALYVERTGKEAAAIEAQMNDGGWFGAEKAVELGFIASVIPATSAKAQTERISTTIKQNKESKMKIKQEGSMAKAFLALGKAMGLVEDETAVSMELTAADGTTITIEREEGDPQVGDPASPDGEFVMEDGSTIVVEEGVITEIKPKEEETEGTDEEVEALKAEVAELKSQLESSNAKVAEQQKAMAKLSSKYNVAFRTQPQGKQTPDAKHDDEHVSVTAKRLEAARAAAKARYNK